MRLTLINQYYAPELAPTGHMATSLAMHRASNGDRVTVITSTGGYVSETSVQPKSPQTNPRVFRLWTPRLGKAHKLNRILDYAAFYLLAAVRMLFLTRQDVIISLTTPPFIAWTAVLHKWLHPATHIVLWNMDCYPEIAEQTGVIVEGGWLSRALRALNRQLFKRLDAVVCLDRAMHDLLQAHYGQGQRSPRFQIIPNWEASAQFPVGLTPSPWVDAPALGLEKPFTILYLGNAGFGHRFETVIEAAEQLKDDSFVFLFVGGGQKWPWLADAVKTRGLENVILRPYVPKETTPAVMATADCALITMTSEALGLISPSKLHANLAMQLPILYIGPEHSNVDEAIQTYGFGLSLRHGEVSPLVKFLRKLRNDSSFHEQYRKAARQAFEEAFCDTRTLPYFDRLLSSLAPDAPQEFPA
jgi:colanic acid biosynthesis glycosyl transferase WcaI